MPTPTHITAAGNIEVPCYLALLALGFTVSRQWIESGQHDELWHAIRDDVHLRASGPIELLGLAKLHELRGNDWLAEDQEIESFMSLFYPD